MPQRPPAICRDCNQVALPGSPYCQSHQQINRAIQASRDRDAGRRELGLKQLYDGAPWRKHTRPFILARDPFCTIAALCGGLAYSTDVDHIVPAHIYVARHGGDLRWFYDPSNLRGACHADHTRKTSLEMRGLWREPEPAPRG